MAVSAIFFSRARSFSETSTAMLLAISMAFSAAIWYPCTIMVGWTFWSRRTSAFLSSSPTSTATVVVPSPTSLSWVLAASMSILAAGCCTSISFKIVTPSLVMVTSPMESTRSLSMPLGPMVLRTALATARAAMMLLEMASFPDSLRVSFKMIIGVPPIPAIR